MTIIERQPSIEPCEEAGWTAFDLKLSRALSKEEIPAFRALGNLVFLSQLRQPFFKVQSAHFTMRGFAGSDTVRVGVDRDCLEEMERIEGIIEAI